jgi:hypothetical protein
LSLSATTKLDYGQRITNFDIIIFLDEFFPQYALHRGRHHKGRFVCLNFQQVPASPNGLTNLDEPKDDPAAV